jgi:uridine phosphorylase
MSVRLNPILPATRDVILVGDPRRAFALGQALTVQPAMSHLSRGLWGYRGETAGGLELTVQATGIGGPSAVAVISDLVAMGVKRLIRLGSCTATGPDAAGDAIEPGRAFLVSEAWCGDGASLALNDGGRRVLPDPSLFAALGPVAEPSRVFSHDLVLRMDEEVRGAGPDPGAPLRDLQTAATLAAARRLGVKAAAVLIVAEDNLGNHLDEAGLEELFTPLARSMTAALETATESPGPNPNP